MIRVPAMHAMTNPARHGLTIVSMFFGQARPKKNQSVVCHGETVRDAEGTILLFVGADENRNPILASHAIEFEAEAQRLHAAHRFHGGE